MASNVDRTENDIEDEKALERARLKQQAEELFNGTENPAARCKYLKLFNLQEDSKAHLETLLAIASCDEKLSEMKEDVVKRISDTNEGGVLREELQLHDDLTPTSEGNEELADNKTRNTTAETYVDVGGGIFLDHTQQLRKKNTVFLGKLGDVRPEPVAVKKIEFSEMHKQEVKILAKLKQNNNTVVYKTSTTQQDELKPGLKSIYIAMELCDKETLYEITEKEELDDECKNTILRQIAIGLKHIHENNIVHRDIKPHNILLSLDGLNIKIAGFGLSKKLEEGRSQVTQTGGGTEGWSAPDEKASFKSDVYAAGLIYFYVLSGGKRAVLKEDGSVNLVGLQTSRPSIAKHLISEMLQKDPKQRPSVNDVLKHPLFWDDDKKLLFLGEVSDCLSPLPGDCDVVKRLDKKDSDIYSSGWLERLILMEEEVKNIQEKLEQDKSKVKVCGRAVHDKAMKVRRGKPEYNHESIYSLIKFIRNRYYHYLDDGYQVQVIFGSQQGIWKFFDDRFPNLFCIVYDFTKEEILTHEHPKEASSKPLAPTKLESYFVDEGKYKPMKFLWTAEKRLKFIMAVSRREELVKNLEGQLGVIIAKTQTPSPLFDDEVTKYQEKAQESIHRLKIYDKAIEEMGIKNEGYDAESLFKFIRFQQKSRHDDDVVLKNDRDFWEFLSRRFPILFDIVLNNVSKHKTFGRIMAEVRTPQMFSSSLMRNKPGETNPRLFNEELVTKNHGSAEREDTAVWDKITHPRSVRVLVDVGNGIMVDHTRSLREDHNVFIGKFKDESVAVKRVKYSDKCEAEVEIMKKLGLHPNVVRFKASSDWGSAEIPGMRYIYVAMELRQKDTLHDKVQQNSFTPQQQVDALLGIARAISHMHENNVVHGDLKPHNILFSLDGNCTKISDFGMSVVIDKEDFSNRAENTAGTYGWRAPDHQVSKQSDIYCAGLVFFYVLSSNQDWSEFQAPDFTKLDSAISKDLIMQMVHSDPMKRLTIFEVINHPFFWSNIEKMEFFCDFTATFGLENEGEDSIMEDWIQQLILTEAEEKELERQPEAHKLDIPVRNVLAEKARQEKYKNSSAFSLIAFITNSYKNFGEESPFQVLFKTRGGMWSYFSERFPKLMDWAYSHSKLWCKNEANSSLLETDLQKIPLLRCFRRYVDVTQDANRVCQEIEEKLTVKRDGKDQLQLYKQIWRIGDITARAVQSHIFTIDLSGENLSFDDLRAICYIIHHQVNMERVHLSDCGLSTHSMTYLEEYVGPENQIQELNIKSNKKLGIEDMLSVVRLMKQGKLKKVICDYQLTGLEEERLKSFLREPTFQNRYKAVGKQYLGHGTGTLPISTTEHTSTPFLKIPPDGGMRNYTTLAVKSVYAEGSKESGQNEQVCPRQEEKRLNVEKTWKEAMDDETYRLDEDKEIGKEGGTVEVGDCKVVIPAGALETATGIRLELTMIPMKEGFIKITPTLKCYPFGIVFSKPVTISLQTWCISEEAGILVSVFCKPNDAEPAYLLTTTELKERLVEFQCTHFTGFEAGVSKDDAGRVIYILKGIIAQNDRDFSVLHYVGSRVTEMRAKELATQYQYNLKRTLNYMCVGLKDVMKITMSTNKPHEMYFAEESQDFEADLAFLESVFSVTRNFILTVKKFSNDVIMYCKRKIGRGSKVDVARLTYKFGKAEERSASLGNEMVASGSVTSGRNTVQADRVLMSKLMYEVIDNIKEVDWLRFARNKLRLKESEIDKIQTGRIRNAVDKKYQMLLLWGRRYEESEAKRQLEAFKSPAGYQDSGPSETRRRTANPNGGRIAKKKKRPACSL